MVRFEPKDFAQRRPDGNDGWLWNMAGMRRVLYRLPELLAANPGEIIFVTEGEKDGGNLTAIGLVATTNPGGAGKWANLSDTFALHGRRVAIIPDRDAPGERHAQQVTAALYGEATEVRVVPLSGNGKDISDLLEEMDFRTPKECRATLLDLFATAPVWELPAAELPPLPLTQEESGSPPEFADDALALRFSGRYADDGRDLPGGERRMQGDAQHSISDCKRGDGCCGGAAGPGGPASRGDR